jgi:drug/metabolite transporter, DME family
LPVLSSSPARELFGFPQTFISTIKDSFIMQKMNAFQPDGFWLVTGAAALWGTIGVATQAIYNIDSTSSLFINLARMLVATPLLLLACWQLVGHKMFQIQRRDLFIMLLSGILLAISHAAYFAAIRYTGVTIATLITICVAPVVVSCLAVMFKLERFNRRLLLALFAALIGTLLLVGFETPKAAQADLLVGTLYALLAALSYGSVIVCGRFLAADYHPLQVTSVSFTAGTVLLLIINLANGFGLAHTSQTWFLLLYLGLVPTAFAYWLFQMGLRSVSASAASIIGMLDPLVAALLAWGLFGETLAPSSIIGAILLIFSIFLLSQDKKA